MANKRHASAELNEQNEKDKESEEELESPYYSKMVKLNKSVCDLVVQHFNKQPSSSFIHIFEYYAKSLADIENENLSKPMNIGNTVRVLSRSSIPPEDPKPSTENPKNEESSKANVSDSNAKNDMTPSSSNHFSFGINVPDYAYVSTGSSFLTEGAPYTFINKQSPAARDVVADGFVEEDASYIKHCRVFVKKDNEFQDLGISTLYLKPVKDTGKTQLLVRSRNILGIILINVILFEGMPVQRLGTNNVILVHPSLKNDNSDNIDSAKFQTTLIRLKDAAEADELHEMITKHCVS